jgi:hypothetical protein
LFSLSPVLRDRPHFLQPPTPGLRLRVLLRWHSLDNRLADGDWPDRDPELSLRARQVTRRRHREAVAKALESLVEVVRDGTNRRSASPALSRRAIRPSLPALFGLARDVREHVGVEPAGVVLAERLITDGAGPLYTSEREDDVARAISAASEALSCPASPISA